MKMINLRRTFFATLFFLIGIFVINAEHYESNKQWYIEAQGGVNFAFGENTREVGTGDVIAGSYTISAGKEFNTLWGLRLQIAGGTDSYAFTENSGYHNYSFDHIGATVQATLNVTNLFRKNKIGDERAWNVNLMLGPGLMYSYDLDTKGYLYDAEARTSFAFYAGAAVSYKFHKNWDANVEAGCHFLTDRYNFLKDGAVLDGLMNLSVGIRYTFR